MAVKLSAVHLASRWQKLMSACASESIAASTSRRTMNASDAPERFTLTVIAEELPLTVWVDGDRLGHGRIPPLPVPVTPDSIVFEVPPP